jgi:hypothetical protein
MNMAFKTEIGRKLERSNSKPDLKRGETFAIFHKSGKLAELILRLYIFVRAGEIAVAAILRKYPPILSKPATLVSGR